MPPRNLTFHRVTVASVARPTPRTVRVTFTGEDLASYPQPGPAPHFKLMLPGPGQDEVHLPEQTPDGPVWPEGDRRPVLRTYTPRRVDVAARELDVDFALHADPGPATQWAATVEPGTQVGVTGARGPYQFDSDGDWLLLAGDETALPAIATILEALPDGLRAVVLAEVADAAEEFSLPAEVRWVHRNGNRPGDLLIDAVRDMTFPDGAGRFWVGAEASAMRAIRKHLLADRGADKSALYTRGYWKQGAANHPDHDTGED